LCKSFILAFLFLFLVFSFSVFADDYDQSFNEDQGVIAFAGIVVAKPDSKIGSYIQVGKWVLDVRAVRATKINEDDGTRKEVVHPDIGRPAQNSDEMEALMHFMEVMIAYCSNDPKRQECWLAKLPYNEPANPPKIGTWATIIVYGKDHIVIKSGNHIQESITPYGKRI
jgi:hypothetical protein